MSVTGAQLHLEKLGISEPEFSSGSRPDGYPDRFSHA